MSGRNKMDEVRPDDALGLQAAGGVLIDVRHVGGGIAAWANAGLPVVRDDGSPGAIA